MSELLYRLALIKSPNIGAVTANNLLNHFGSAEYVFQATTKSLMNVPYVGEVSARAISSGKTLDWAENEMKFIEDNKISVLFKSDANYPTRLKNCFDAPLLLYYKGTADLNHGRIISIVGTRQISSYGQRMCTEIVEALEPYNPIIVSGLALGVDGAAHWQALQNKMSTVGVMGTGFKTIYPSLHKGMAEKMLTQGGLISEYPSDQGPDREHFPMRNRIISGMCDALIVIETALKGGSMITANIAHSYDREIFAVPGRIGDKISEGCLHLIQTLKAQIVSKPSDIANSLGWETLDAPKAIQPQLFLDLKPNEALLVNLLKTSEKGILIDALTNAMQLSHSAIAGILFELELKNIVKVLPGKRYMLVNN